MKRIVASGIAAALVLASCATTQAFHFQPVENGSAKVEQSGSQVYEVGANSVVAIGVEAAVSHGDHVFWVRVLNKTTDRLAVSDSDFTLAVSDDGASWKPGKLYSSEDAALVLPYSWAAYDVDRLPRSDFGGSPGVLGAVGDFLQSTGANAGGHPEMAAKTQESRTRQQLLAYYQQSERMTLARSLFRSTVIGPNGSTFNSCTGMLVMKSTPAAFVKLIFDAPHGGILSFVFQRIDD